jgi:hypothetical protein
MLSNIIPSPASVKRMDKKGCPPHPFPDPIGDTHLLASNVDTHSSPYLKRGHPWFCHGCDGVGAGGSIPEFELFAVIWGGTNRGHPLACLKRGHPWFRHGFDGVGAGEAIPEFELFAVIWGGRTRPS